MSAVIGDWKLKHDLRLRMGITAFGLPAGAIVAVTQLDPDFKKVMVEVGPSVCDWMAEGWLLDNFELVEAATIAACQSSTQQPGGEG